MYNYTRANNSSVTTSAIKPDLSAPGTYATTGVASANRTQKYTTGSSGFYKYGAGIIDARAALWVISQGRYTASTQTITATTQKKSYSMAVASSDTLMRVALSYSNEAKITASDHTSIGDENAGAIAELKLEILTPNGQTISCSTLGANLKVLEFKPSEYGGAGIYTINVIQTSPASDGRTTFFGIAWR